MKRELNTHKKDDIYSKLVREGEEELYREKTKLTSLCDMIFSKVLVIFSIYCGLALIGLAILSVSTKETKILLPCSFALLGICLAELLVFLGRSIIFHSYCTWCKHYFSIYRSSEDEILGMDTTPITRIYTTTETYTDWRGNTCERDVDHISHGERRKYYYKYYNTCECCGRVYEIHAHKTEEVYFD